MIQRQTEQLINGLWQGFTKPIVDCTVNYHLFFTDLLIMPAKKVLPNPFGRGLIDSYTGEVYDGITVIVGRKYNPYAKGWIMNSQEALEILAKDKDIKWDTHRILYFIASRLDFENWVQISLKEIADELEMNKSVVSRNIKILEEKEILVRGEKLGRSYAFRLNPNFGLKGKVKNLNEYRQEQQDRENREFKNKHLRAVDNPIKPEQSE